MKKLYHLCFTSKSEVCCRDAEDYKTMISRIAQSAVINNANVWAYAVMSNHVHIIAQSDCPQKFIKTIRNSYNQSFNRKYQRRGSLGDRGFFKTVLQGVQHTIDALTYVMQNPWHHKIVANPYDYPFSSMGLYFKNVGRQLSPMCVPLKQPSRRHRLVSRYLTLLKELYFDTDGMVAPISFVETNLVENIFGSYNAFQYLTHRKNYREWMNAQLAESSDTPIVNLSSIEPLLEKEDVMKIENSGNKWMKERDLTDIEVCRMIDGYYLPRLRKQSYVQLNNSECERIMKDIMAKHPYKVTKSQVLRCLGCGI